MKAFRNLIGIFNLKGAGQYLIGVDIGTSALKVVGIRTIPRTSLDFASIVELPQGHTDQYIVDSIQKALKANRVTARDAVLAFTDDSTVVRRMEIPQVASDELADALKWQIKDIVHFDAEKGIVDFQMIGEIQRENGSRKMQIVFAALLRENLERRVGILKAAGLNVVSVSMAPFGLEGMIRIHEDPEFSKTVAVAEIGYTKTEISIFKNRGLEFVRTIPVGCCNISDSITAYSLSGEGGAVIFSKEEVENFKRTIGISYEDVPAGKGISSMQLLSAIRPMLERCSKEIARSIEYYLQEYGKEEISVLYLVGGGSSLKNLDKFLSEELRIPAKKLSLPKAIDTSRAGLKEGEEALLAPIVGLAVGYKKCLNLLPHEYRVERIEFIEKISLRTAAVIAAVILFVLFLLVKFRVDDYQYRLKSAKFQKGILGQVEDLQDRVTERALFMAQAQASEAPTEQIMKELSSVIPSNVVLEHLRLDQRGKTLDMSGVVYEPKGLAQDILTKFMETLERSKYFKDAQLVSLHGTTTAARAEISNFEISSSLE